VQVEATLALSVVVRWGLVRTAVNGTLVARPARTTFIGRGVDGRQLDWRAGAVLGDRLPRGQEPGGLAAARWEDSNSISHIYLPEVRRL
jgi:hypothetical protein